MKTIHNIKTALLLLFGSVLGACSFLDTDPYVIPGKGYYDSEQKIIYGLAGIYGVMSSEELYGCYYSLQISNADDLCYYNNYNNAEARPDKYNHTAGTEAIYKVWSKLYEGIKNANEFLEAMEQVEIDPAKMTHELSLYKAEARFLRAYYHFLLAQAWGNVPLRVETVTSPNPSDVQKASTPQAEVLAWCAAEMEQCLPDLDEGVDGTPSRVNQSVAHGILARLYLFMAGESVAQTEGTSKQSLYGLAADHAHSVIRSGLHGLNPDYKQVFINMIQDKYDTEWHESMWEVEFSGDRSSASSWSNGRIGEQIGLKSQSSKSNYSEWACNYSYGYYNGTYRLWQLYFATDRTDDEMQDATVNNAAQLAQIKITDVRQEWNLPPYNYAGANGRTLNYTTDGTKYSEKLTIAASMYKTPWIYNNYFSLPAEEINGIDLTIENPFNIDHALYDPTLMAAVRNAGKWRRETIYEPQQPAKRLYTTINFPILRYADVLLMYAEAVTLSTGAPDDLARECLVKVRNRAGIKTDETRLTDPQSFLALLRNERARELAFEGIRKWDLIRWGTFVEEMHSAGTEVPDLNKWKNATIVAFASANYESITQRHVYLPVPTKELAVNRALKQNPLW